MTPNDAKTTTGFADEEYGLPCSEALLAGALALMTGHAQACCDGRRQLLARKVADNLQLLAQHAALSPDFRAMLGRLQQHWAQQDSSQAQLSPQALIHRAPGTLQ